MSSSNYDDLFQSNSNTDSCAEKPTCAFTHHLDILRKAPVFSGASLDILKLCAYMARSVEYKKGDLILKKGDRAESAYFVMEGELEAYQEIPDDPGDAGRPGDVMPLNDGEAPCEQFVFQRMSAFDIFAELALLADFNSFVNVRACTDVKLLALDRQSFQKIISKFEARRNELVEKIVQLRVKRFEHQMTLFVERLKDEKRRGGSK